jgi:hypothetical protein
MTEDSGYMRSMVLDLTREQEQYFRQRRIQRDMFLYKMLLEKVGEPTTLFKRYNHYRNKFEKGTALSDDEAFVVTGVNSIAHIIAIPGLYPLFPEFLTQARAFDYLELTGNLKKRDENTLFMGSGRTMPEVLAWKLKPPELHIVEKAIKTQTTDFLYCLSSDPSEDEMYRLLEEVQKRRDELIQLRSGSSESVEPDHTWDRFIPIVGNAYGLDTGNVHYSDTLAGYLQSQPPTGQFNNLVLQRADPAVYMQQDGSGGLSDDFIKMLGYVGERGEVFISVGLGNSREEYNQRVHFLNGLENIRSMGFSYVPHVFTGNNWHVEPEDASIKDLLFGMEDDICAAVVLRRKAEGKKRKRNNT